MNKQIVYILSTNYAGSHFLALQLGSHPRCISLGEPHHQRKGDASPRACFRCESDMVCPIYKGVRDVPLERFYDHLLENLAAWDSTIDTAIDNSKKVRWVRHYLDHPGFDKKFIHLIRDPRALVRRWLLSFDTSKIKLQKRLYTARRCWRNAPDILLGDQVNVYIWHWLHLNRQITTFLNKHKLGYRVVTYHDLVFETDSVLGELMAWIGHDYDPSQKAYWNFTHHGTHKPQYMKPPENEEKLFDQRWKTFLDDKTQQRILHHPAIKAYLDRIGVTFDANQGLLGRRAVSKQQ